MNDSPRTRDGLSAVENHELLHFDFAALERPIGFGALRLWQPVYPQEVRSALQLFFIPRFGKFHVAVEGGEGIRTELSRLRRRGFGEARGEGNQDRCCQDDCPGHAPTVGHIVHLSLHPAIVNQRSDPHRTDFTRDSIRLSLPRVVPMQGRRRFGLSSRTNRAWMSADAPKRVPTRSELGYTAGKGG